MGYRHQFWVVAQLEGRYRTLAVVSSMNCGDTDAIHGCWRLLQIFGSHANRTLLRRDLEHAARQDQDWWESTRIPHEADDGEKLVPFPFVQTCLSLGASFDSRLDPYPYVYPVTAYEPSITPMNLIMNNQSGSTIIDITDLHRLQYCFMFYPSWRDHKVMQELEEERKQCMSEEEQLELSQEEDMEKQCDFLRCRPLTAETYLTWPWLEKHEFDPYVDLSPWDLITPDILHDLWRQVPWPHQDSTSLGAGQSQDHQNQDGHRQMTNMPSPTAGILPDVIRQLSLEENRHKEGHIMEVVERMPVSSKELLQALWKLGPEHLQHSSVMSLLQQAVRQDGATLDFSPFPWLPEPVVSQLLEALAIASDDDMHEAIIRVDLSGNRSISATLVARLLELYPNVTTLTLFHTSSNLSLQSLSSVLTWKSGIELHHSELFSAAFVDTEPGDWHDEPYQGHISSILNHAPQAIGTVDRVLFLSIMQDIPKQDDPLRLQGGGLKWSDLLSQDVFGFCRREPPFLHIDIPLHDAFLDPLRSSSWLSRLLWYFATNSATNDRRSWRGGHASLGCAFALAMDIEVS